MSSNPDDQKTLRQFDDRIEFVIEARADIQRTLFALYRFVRDDPKILREKVHQQAFQLLVGAAFSLWRAIFLAEAERDWKSISGSLEKFLKKVVTDNAITYQDDKANSSWTVGYYLGSAEMRLDKAWETLLRSPQLSAATQSASLTLAKTWELSREHTLLEWRITYDALCSLFNILNPNFPATKTVKFGRSDGSS